MRTRKISGIRSLAVLPSLFLFSPAFAGYSMTPLVTILDPSANSTSAEVVIKSEKGDARIPLAIELKVKGREVSLDGSTVLYNDDKSASNFLVYPSQIVLMPGENHRVQIKWVGDAIPKKEISYGLIAEQAPVKLGDEDKPRTRAEGRLIILGRYEGIILVQCKGCKPNVAVDSAGPMPDSTGKTWLSVLLNNTGSARQVLAGIQLQVTPVDKNGKIVINQAVVYRPVIPDVQTRQKLYAGFRRRLVMPWPENVPVGPVKVTVKFEQEKE
jgi:fimbrial chaperone protein